MKTALRAAMCVCGWKEVSLCACGDILQLSAKLFWPAHTGAFQRWGGVYSSLLPTFCGAAKRIWPFSCTFLLTCFWSQQFSGVIFRYINWAECETVTFRSGVKPRSSEWFPPTSGEISFTSMQGLLHFIVFRCRNVFYCELRISQLQTQEVIQTYFAVVSCRS